MAIQVQLRRGTTAQNNAFTGAVGEVTVDTDKDTAVVHDGATAGGFPLVGEKGTQTITGVKTFSSSVLTTTDINGGTIDGTAIGGASAAAGAFTTLAASGVTTVQAGTNSAPAITTTGDTNTGIFFPAADQVAVATNGVERVNLGNSATVFNDGGADVDFRVEGDTDANLLFVNASTDRVGVGTDTPVAPLHVLGVNSTGFTGTAIQNQNVNLGIAGVEFSTDNTYFKAAIGQLRNDSNGKGPLIFYVDSNSDAANWSAGDEKARITDGGYFKASNDGSYRGVAVDYHELYTNKTNANVAIFTNSAASPYGPEIRFSGATPNNTTNFFLTCNDSTNVKAIIYSDGSFQSRADSYGGISDVKLKQDIVDANSQWNDIKGLRIRKYRFKEEVASDPNYPAYIGVIAQEVELVSPGLVFESPDMEEVTKTREVEKTREVTPAVLDDDGNETEPAVMETYTEEEEYTERVATGTVTKGVKSSVIYMKAVKALQEAMERIETLEAKVAALEGN
jgi:hypothetical protein